jgi:beta-phosphoglucomutase-like phosphatase (HAD superfamily)
MIAAIDFDHTIWDTPNNTPIKGAREAINLLREKGIKVIIHSCNNKSWIEKCLNNNDIRFDWIWDQTGKPVADIYIDDCGYHFTNWEFDLPDILSRLNKGNPMVSR